MARDEGTYSAGLYTLRQPAFCRCLRHVPLSNALLLLYSGRLLVASGSVLAILICRAGGGGGSGDADGSGSSGGSSSGAWGWQSNYPRMAPIPKSNDPLEVPTTLMLISGAADPKATNVAPASFSTLQRHRNEQSVATTLFTVREIPGLAAHLVDIDKHNKVRSFACGRPGQNIRARATSWRGGSLKLELYSNGATNH
jgi:hypothetical protein